MKGRKGEGEKKGKMIKMNYKGECRRGDDKENKGGRGRGKECQKRSIMERNEKEQRERERKMRREKR